MAIHTVRDQMSMYIFNWRKGKRREHLEQHDSYFTLDRVLEGTDKTKGKEVGRTHFTEGKPSPVLLNGW